MKDKCCSYRKEHDEGQFKLLTKGPNAAFCDGYGRTSKAKTTDVRVTMASVVVT